MGELMYTVLLIAHVISIVAAIGTVTVIDYLHIIGLRRKKLEKKFVSAYPFLSNFINIALSVVIITGVFLLLNRPALLESPLFITKIALVVLVSINGMYLQKIVSPNLNKCVIKGTKYCTSSVLYSSAVAGSFSLVTWYSILILSLTKTSGYSAGDFLTVYLIVLIVAVLLALYLEKRARKWRFL